MLEHLVEVVLESLIPLCELMGILIIAVSTVADRKSTRLNSSH